MYDNDELLQTSTLLRQRVDNNPNKWLTTTIGESKFVRNFEISGTKNVVSNQHYSATGVCSTELS